ncbi:unnamed protein product [Phaeothamnion confervicola]
MARSDPWQSAAAALAALGIAASLLPQNALADELIPGTAGCAIASNPSTTTVSCLRVGLDKNGRLPSCRTNENCVSTSSVKVPSKFVAPWNYAPRTTDAAVAFSQLVNELRGMDGAALTEVDTAGLYLRAEFPSTASGKKDSWGGARRHCCDALEGVEEETTGRGTTAWAGEKGRRNFSEGGRVVLFSRASSPPHSRQPTFVFVISFLDLRLLMVDERISFLPKRLKRIQFLQQSPARFLPLPPFPGDHLQLLAANSDSAATCPGTSTRLAAAAVITKRPLLRDARRRCRQVPPNSVDVVEFVLRPDENLALFRSATRDSVFVYPLQQPLSDRGGNARRLEDVRTRLGWASLRYTGDGSE